MVHGFYGLTQIKSVESVANNETSRRINHYLELLYLLIFTP